MRSVAYLAMALLLGAVACEETPNDPGPQPDPATMTFKSGARYEYESYHTDATSGQRTDSTSRRRTWTLVNASATAYGKTGVAVYVDSVFSTVGGLISVADSVYLKQETNNDVYRYASLAPELDLSGVALLDIGRSWMHEAKLNATTARWFVGDVADTLTIPTGIPGLDQVRIALTDSATASTNENVTIGGTTYKATKTTHKLELGFFILGIPIINSVKVASESMTRTTWIVPELGAIVKEVREGKLVTVDQSIPGMPGQSANFAIPIPGYYSELKTVLATGN